MFHYCPNCASVNIKFEREQRLSCSDCGFVYFQNIAAATGCLISADRGILLIERNKEPAKGKLGTPGGFVNPNEGAVEGVRRECLEEIGFDPGEGVQFLASFPNVYPYKGIVYHTCDLYFTVSVPSLTLSDLKIDPKEVGGVRFIKPADIDLEDIAFESARQALRFFLDL